jgi:hypothetical protein
VSFEDDSEPVEHELFGLKFKATYKEQRQIWRKLSLSPESHEWGILRNLVMLIQAPVPMPVHDSIAERMEKADKAMTKLAYRLIDEMLAARAN